MSDKSKSPKIDIYYQYKLFKKIMVNAFYNLFIHKNSWLMYKINTVWILNNLFSDIFLNIMSCQISQKVQTIDIYYQYVLYKKLWWTHFTTYSFTQIHHWFKIFVYTYLNRLHSNWTHQNRSIFHVYISRKLFPIVVSTFH